MKGIKGPFLPASPPWCPPWLSLLLEFFLRSEGLLSHFRLWCSSSFDKVHLTGNFISAFTTRFTLIISNHYSNGIMLYLVPLKFLMLQYQRRETSMEEGRAMVQVSLFTLRRCYNKNVILKTDTKYRKPHGKDPILLLFNSILFPVGIL